jgi:thioredoxin reductase (NADPH)
MRKQAVNFGAQIKTGAEVTSLEKQDDGKIAVVCDEDKYIGRAAIIAVGSDYRKLGVPGEDKFRNAGAGVSYCGTCDAPFRATKVLQEELMSKVKEPNSNLVLKCNMIVTAIEGGEKVQSVRLKNLQNGKEESYPCDGVFIFIGMVPNTGFLEGFLELSDNGFVKCECAYLRTAVPGVFVAGDCRVGAAMQLATAVGDGVVTAMMMKQYFRDPKWWNEQVSDILQPGGW